MAMGLCTDKSTTYLKDRGYNVVRHPNERLKPLDLIGRQGDSKYLGSLDKLITNPPGPLPAIDADIVAADINGQKSSKLDLGIGINILGNLIGAMGGNLGLNVNYTDAQKVEFAYEGVTNDQAVPLDIGDYLRDGVVDAGNIVLKEYVLGRGELFLITKTAKSKTFKVKFERKNGTAAKVDVPVLSNAVGGNIQVDASGESNSTITFTGPKPLVFGFECFRVAVKNGELGLVSVQAGNVVMAAGGVQATKGEILEPGGLLDVADL
jgi:hypothetical protein